MKVDAVGAGHKRHNRFYIAAQLVYCARLARIIARYLNASAGQFAADFFKTADIVALPAMQRYGRFFENL